MSVEFLATEQATFPVHANSLKAAAEVISEMDEAGKAEWFPRYDYETTGGELTSAAVTVGSRITLPQWTSYGSACQAERVEWDRFSLALLSHEQSHIELAIKYLEHLDEQLIGKSVSEAAQIWHSALAELQSSSRAYDAETDHGRAQGTIIDVTVGTLSTDT